MSSLPERLAQEVWVALTLRPKRLESSSRADHEAIEYERGVVAAAIRAALTEAASLARRLHERNDCDLIHSAIERLRDGDS